MQKNRKLGQTGRRKVTKTPMENLLTRYLEDAIAAEKSFETQLRGFAKEATNEDARTAFSVHADETRLQYEILTGRLSALGAEPSTLKSALAHLFNSAPKAAQVSHTGEERTTQDLMMAFAVENAEVAMYESLAIAAETFEDHQTVTIAREIQAQEKATAEKVWKLIAPSAREAYLKASADAKHENPLLAYLEDTEAAERNFEDALASFSKMGDQPEVQSLLSMMSGKARTQHERLEKRLRDLGGSPSTAKSLLAHLLAFTPLAAQMGHSESEKSTQHLMITYAAAAAEMAMYESLATAAETAGDMETARLARELQSEEKEDHVLAWDHLAPSARHAMMSVVS
jgi:ferritin-like metal-binding protein YciE